MLMITIWCVLAVSLIDALALPILAQAAAYLAAGILWLWLFPMKRLLRWMELGKWRV
ncbi:hypothetical protein FHS49_001139 [Sphingobium boeckii]|uniref:DUF2842 domain-containing protein n=2 Tax=Sphingobium boeckii TaxID=1082345 RepID=A0A7W9EEY0_9SPHN|nr:hypothetical protein [Sphingobium boeckii]